MRKFAKMSSRKYVTKDGSMPNAKGESVGFNKDGFKLAGGRMNLSKHGNPLTKQPLSTFGGIQGDQGSFLGYKYGSGSWQEII